MGDFGYAMLTVVLSLSVVVGLAVAIFNRKKNIFRINRALSN